MSIYAKIYVFLFGNTETYFASYVITLIWKLLTIPGLKRTKERSQTAGYLSQRSRLCRNVMNFQHGTKLKKNSFAYMLHEF